MGSVRSRNALIVSSYSYDSNSNRTGGSVYGTTTTGVYDAQDRLNSYNVYNSTYNANGELQQKTNTLLSTSTSYVYDVFGNLKEVTLPSADVISYEVDGLNRRIGKKLNGVLQKRWVYMDQLRIAGELDASGNISKRFVYASKQNIPDYMIYGGENYRIISDHLGSLRLVIKVSDGTIVQRMDHDEFGRVIEDTNPGFLPFGFAGGLYDHQTGLVRFGARDYDPEIGRWTSKDPILFAGGDANLYGYVANDPINFVDLSGLKLEFGSSQARQQLSGSMSQIWSTPAGRALISQLNGSRQVYSINVNSSGEHYQQGNMVTVDPNDFPGVNASPLGVIPASTTRILGHELGHLTGTVDDGNLNVSMWENPIMTGLGGFPRISYGTSGVRCGR